ncbi:MAG TPA: glycosyltransferase [Saprospiraceae bacterium]|nr:glycosyltransferase [Saprospiraceae bacterium]
MNKTALIITYYWPPSSGGGVQRWLKFTKYMPEYGWKPVVYTPANPDFHLKDETLLDDIHPEVKVLKKRIIEPYFLLNMIPGIDKKEINTGNQWPSADKLSLISRVIAWVRGHLFIPDPRILWKRPSVRFLSGYLKNNKIDVIITTGPPHSMHLIGLALKKKFPDIPWVADFRDPWSQLDYYQPFLNNPSLKKKHVQLEKCVLDGADVVLATSPHMHECLTSFDLRKFACITNGFDNEDFEKDISTQLNDTPKDIIRIVHAGLLKQDRKPVQFLEAVRQWVNEDPGIKGKLEILFFGNVDPHLEEEISMVPELKDLVRFPGYIPHPEIVQWYKKSALLLLLVNNTQNSKVNIPGKTFEYLASGKPVLCLSQSDADVVTLLKGMGHVRCLEYNDPVATYKTSIFELLKTDKKIAEEEIKKFSRKSLSEELTKLLHQLIQ